MKHDLKQLKSELQAKTKENEVLQAKLQEKPSDEMSRLKSAFQSSETENEILKEKLGEQE